MPTLASLRTVRIEIDVQPCEELEYKAKLAAGEPLLYFTKLGRIEAPATL